MSQQQFSTRERQAFWDVYGKKCHYHKGDLLLSEVELDHVVPEELLALPKSERVRQLKEWELPETFDISAYENIVVSCSTCNGDKGSLKLYEKFLGITLARAAVNAPKVRAKVNARIKTAEREKLLIVIVAAIDAGKLTGPAIVEHLRTAGRLGLPTGTSQHIPPVQIRQHIIFSRQAMRDLNASGETLTLEKFVRMIGHDETRVLKAKSLDGHLVTEVRNDDMRLMYLRLGDTIHVLSARFRRELHPLR